MGFFALNSGTFGALKRAKNGSGFESWGVEGDNFKLVRNGTCMKRETGPGPPVELADKKFAQGKTPGAAGSGPVKRTGHDHANRTTQHH
jgi:hypothetical protein